MRGKLPWTVGAVVAVIAVVLAIIFYPVLRSASERLFHGGQSSEAGAAPTPIATADLSGTSPGSLVSAMSMPDITSSSLGRKLQAARVVYRSTDGDTGRPTEVSGSVFTPHGDPPDGGWPVVSYGHGTTGIDPTCGPSLSNNLLGQLELVSGLVNAGYAVAFTDYQGLGHDGAPAYLDSRTAAFNMIDAVRALRATFPGVVSKRWGAFGGSQGGGASWSAAEQAHVYAPELDLVGAVAVSPGADISGYVDKAQAGTLTSDQKAVMQLFVESLARRYPDVNRDDYRRGDVARDWNTLSACTGPLVAGRTAAIDAIGPMDLAPSTPEAAQRLREKLQQWALPQLPLSAPLSVTYGGKDTFIDSQWTAGAIQRACALGGTVAIHFGPDYKHSEADFPAEIAWLADRFAGKPAHNDCP
jgi:alpha-beta hydrolase superfamily lysophospholipase